MRCVYKKQSIHEPCSLVTSYELTRYYYLSRCPHLIHRGRDEVKCSTSLLRRRCCRLFPCWPHPLFLFVWHPLGEGQQVLRTFFPIHGRARFAQPCQVAFRRSLRRQREQKYLHQVSPKAPPDRLGRRAAITTDHTQNVHCCVYLVAHALPPGMACNI